MREWRAVHLGGCDFAEPGLKVMEEGSAHMPSCVTLGTALHFLLPQMELMVTPQDA